jgi:hypothetical protein
MYNKELTGPVLPWWRIRMVWLALGGPLLVVMASMATLVLAIHGRDLPVAEAAATPRTDADAPALQARNHAATAQHR